MIELKKKEFRCIPPVEYIWDAGVGFAHSQPHLHYHDQNRQELLLLLLTCFSETMYVSSPTSESEARTGRAENSSVHTNRWITYFTSTENRHALPLFTSLLNTVCSYDPVGLGIPYNHLMFTDSREPLVEVALQVLCVCLENDPAALNLLQNEATSFPFSGGSGCENLFVNYMSRIHRDEDFNFILAGVTRLLNNPLQQTYLPGSCKRIQFYQELLILLWKMCDINKKFMYYILKTHYVLDVLVPVLYQLNDARQDPSRVGLVHIGVFLLLLLSGERNFGVRLNRTYTQRVAMDVPVFTGSHADLLIVVFHRMITTGHQRLQPLFDCLLTIMVNISPYLKALSMVSTTKLLHLLEAFSTPWFLFSNQSNHHLVFFLLEVFNNIIQYQFDGNSNLIYTIIRKRNVFHQLANLPTDQMAIGRALAQRKASASAGGLSSKSVPTRSASIAGDVGVKASSVLTSTPATQGSKSSSTVPSSPALKKTERSGSSAEASSGGAESAQQMMLPATASLAATPNLCNMTETHQQHGQGSSSSVAGESPPKSPAQYDYAEHGTTPKVAEMPYNPASTSVAAAMADSQLWTATQEWVLSWKQKLPLQTIMRLLQVLVPQVEKICIDRGLTDETEILRFLQHGTLVGLLPVPHPILIRKYQPNAGTTLWFRTYMWGVIYIRNVDPSIWYDTDVRLFEIQRS